MQVGPHTIATMDSALRLDSGESVEFSADKEPLVFEILLPGEA
jgi:hypothetical protein